MISYRNHNTLGRLTQASICRALSEGRGILPLHPCVLRIRKSCFATLRFRRQECFCSGSICRGLTTYAIIKAGKAIRYVQRYVDENPGSCRFRGFLFRFFEGGLCPRLIAVVNLYPAICKCSRQPHLPRQRQ